jgi:hypothetical protein
MYKIEGLKPEDNIKDVYKLPKIVTELEDEEK